MVDAHASGACGAIHGGSSPLFGTRGDCLHYCFSGFGRSTTVGFSILKSAIGPTSTFLLAALSLSTYSNQSALPSLVDKSGSFPFQYSLYAATPFETSPPFFAIST